MEFKKIKEEQKLSIKNKSAKLAGQNMVHDDGQDDLDGEQDD